MPHARMKKRNPGSQDSTASVRAEEDGFDPAAAQRCISLVVTILS